MSFPSYAIPFAQYSHINSFKITKKKEKKIFKNFLIIKRLWTPSFELHRSASLVNSERGGLFNDRVNDAEGVRTEVFHELNTVVGFPTSCQQRGTRRWGILFTLTYVQMCTYINIFIHIYILACKCTGVYGCVYAYVCVCFSVLISMYL